MSFRTSAGVAFIVVVIIIMALTLRLDLRKTIGEHLFINPLQYAEISSTSTQQLAAVDAVGQLDLPILVYHIVRPSYPSDSEAVKALAQTPEVFDAQMQYLKTAGYTVVLFSALENHFTRGTPLPPHPIIITFDDGWSDQYLHAFPILKKYNYPATFFIFTNSIGRPSFLSWDNLREIQAAGMTIGDHSRSHPYLTKNMDEKALWTEIDGSKKILEKGLGVTVQEFAYPFGKYNPAIVEMVKKAGYRSARGDLYSGKQTIDRLYELSAMNAPTTLQEFSKKYPPR